MSLKTSSQALADEPNKVLVFFSLLLGIIFHWIYEVAVAAIKADGEWVFGTRGVILARIVISLVASVVGLVAAYNQVKKADEGFRAVTAFVLGLSVDAMTSPWTVPASTS